ncbi:hypothetical protein [Bradyrhizobium sp.]|uniref:hypothetical protein n=1 Tax=Bradyrhizobium sp. TaxID=376 RepID=UPI004037DC3F
MRRVLVVAVAGMGLAGCSSFSLDSFKSTPPPVQVALESVPSGAEARTSNGQTCKTPCTVNAPAGEPGFSVTFALNKFEPATVPVQVIYHPGDFTTPASTTVDPNPVIAELKPAGPPPKPIRAKPKRPKPKPATAAAAPPPSPFPNPPPPTR